MVQPNTPNLLNQPKRLGNLNIYHTADAGKYKKDTYCAVHLALSSRGCQHHEFHPGDHVLLLTQDHDMECTADYRENHETHASRTLNLLVKKNRTVVVSLWLSLRPTV